MQICKLLGFLSLIVIIVNNDASQNRHSRSVVNMDDLLKTEEDLVQNLERYTVVLSQKAKIIRWGIRQMEELHQKENILRNGSPSTFSLIRHMQADWLMWLEYLERPVGLEQLEFLNATKESLPQDYDFYDAADAIRRVQKTYGLLSKDIASGLLNGVQYNSSLESIDSLAVAHHLMRQLRWSYAEQWILAGIETQDRKASKTEMHLLTGPTKAKLYRDLGKVLTEQGKQKEALEAYEAALKLAPHDVETFHEYKNLRTKALTILLAEPIEKVPKDDIEKMQLPPCCSGHCERRSELKRLYCVYNHATAPFLVLSPIKTEILSLDPFMAILHDMVSPKESALIRSSSKSLMVPSLTANPDDPDNYLVGKFRTSKAVWLDSDGNEVTSRLSQRLEEATGLDMNRSEPFQVMNYGIGGFFETHYDLFLSDEDRFQVGYVDRLATTLFYLSDVPQGGGTYFPGLNITVFPKFGAALFWYNLDTKGNQQLRAMHTGCPVIVGSKWVMSKWIDDQGQEFKRPCVKESSDTMHLPSIERLII
ncbi:prolyl 4-hydroxylase subunit alpha-1 [Drosophila biarmipes]|uniref:prolyl 4-hydroxylase subunit alpha-1 n=1 Tax=Drosophila biarmipes TaxID=125945 RepID=UPI0007E7C565|nr:prolyl 4-hydroxylase subunit alpha-1 [Drosophila biarmipes]